MKLSCLATLLLVGSACIAHIKHAEPSFLRRRIDDSLVV